MHMTQNDKIAFAFLSGAGITLLATTAAWFWDKRQHVKAKKETKSNAIAEAELSRMIKAAEVVTQNIRDGKYDKTGIPGIKNDFDFYRMIIDTEI